MGIGQQNFCDQGYNRAMVGVLWDWVADVFGYVIARECFKMIGGINVGSKLNGWAWLKMGLTQVFCEGQCMECFVCH